MAGRKKTTTKKTAAKTSALSSAIKSINNVLKTEDWKVELDANSYQESFPCLTTGSVTIDYLIGGKVNEYGVAPCPGLPRGRITNLYGHETSGKTTLALTAAAKVCQNGGTVLYLDWENTIAPTYAKSLGVPIEDQDRFLLACPDTLEEGMKILWACAVNGVDLLVIDSVGAGVPEDQLNEKDKGRMGRVGLIAAKWSQFLPQFQRILRKSQSTVIGISQLRKKINTGGYGGDTTQVQGGEAWKFYSTLRIKLARVKTERGKSYNAATHKVEDQVYGGVCKAKLDKNKISATQGNDIEYYIRWGEGIDDVRSIMEIAAKHGIVKKAGAWYKWSRPDGEISGQGIEKFRQGILDANAFDELYQLTINKLMGEPDGATPLEEEDDFEDLSFMTSEADSPAN